MKQKIKGVLKNILPPIIINVWKKPTEYGFFGNYASWKEALADSDGYDSPIIFEKVKEAARKVKGGLAVSERDGVTFDTKKYSWPVVATLLWSASRHENNLNVLDFGGAFGSVYFQNIEFFKYLKNLRWVIVEQKKLSEHGRQYFQNEQLLFRDSLEEGLREIRPQVFLASSAIQYIENPYELLTKVVSSRFESVVFDRTPLWDENDCLTIQKVSPRIYDASYSAWILNSTKLKEFFERNGYSTIVEYNQDTMSYNGTENLVPLRHFTFSKK